MQHKTIDYVLVIILFLTAITCNRISLIKLQNTDGFVQDCSNSIASALELLHSCT